MLLNAESNRGTPFPVSASDRAYKCNQKPAHHESAIPYIHMSHVRRVSEADYQKADQQD